ncbi:MAG: c-type cytochrome [Acidobacteria bacterium]|nr:c-type cytochrome [Acidobacteriota bacterium]
MKRIVKLGLIATMAVALLGLFVFVRTLRYGFSALDEPMAIETFMAKTMRHWAVPSDLRDAKNPLPLTPELLAEARTHFADHCATCHGNDGKGETSLGAKMYPPTPDMTLSATQSMSDGELFATIENGIRLTGMPGFGSGTAESARGSWSLVHFIRHMPKLTPEELVEMESLNPKSPEEWEALKAEEEFLSGGGTEKTAVTSSQSKEQQPQPHHH